MNIPRLLPALALILLFFGCSSVGWYKNYGMTNQDELLYPENITTILKAARTDSSRIVRIKAIQALKQHSTLPLYAIDSLEKTILNEQRWDVKLYIAETLTAQGAGKKALPELKLGAVLDNENYLGWLNEKKQT